MFKAQCSCSENASVDWRYGELQFKKIASDTEGFIVEWQAELTEALSGFAVLFTDEHTVAAYELQSSGVVSTLLTSLNPEEAGVSKKFFYQRLNTFKKVFAKFPQK